VSSSSFPSRHYPSGINFACFVLEIKPFPTEWFNYQQLSANPMPFFRNGVNHLYFQKKAERQKSQMLYSLAENITMCYSNVTRWLHSLLLFAKEGILLEF
jgi:hypothetical protein